MIRFCDKEVSCVIQNEIDREGLMSYFLSGHRGELVCVLNKEGKFAGTITYASLLGKEISGAIKPEYVVLDENIWKNGRIYFKGYKKGFDKTALLPVLNSEGELLCFAWEDDQANREIRMLDELMELDGDNVLGFRDVYPEYDCVTIHECNELAYYFVKYLEKSEIPVRVTGMLWDGLGIKKEEVALEHKTLEVYAEGTGVKEENVSMRKSVSAEFECIDRIYEENIRGGVISDPNGSFGDLIERLREKKIAILGTGTGALNAYGLLLGHGIDICYFISEDAEEHGKQLFGKKIIKGIEARNSEEQLIFIDVNFRYSAWGSGGTDLFHYWGFRRNRGYFLLKDFTDIPGKGFVNVLKHIMSSVKGCLILMGDTWFCLKIWHILGRERGCPHEKIKYADLHDLKNVAGMNTLDRKEIGSDDVCVLVLPECYGYYTKEGGEQIACREIITEQYKKKLKELNLENVGICILDNITFPEENSKKRKVLKVGKILLGLIDSVSGNTLFRNLLDNHPDVLMLDYGFLNSNLWSVCERLAMEQGENILSLFWKILHEEGKYNSETERDEFPEKDKFDAYMREMLKSQYTFLPQELFVIIHVSYAKMWGKKINDISSLVIYWEPHHVPKEVCYAEWLSTACVSGYIISIVRNMLVRAGSWIRTLEEFMGLSYSGRTVFSIISCPDLSEEKYDGWERINIKFEDLKCSPRDTMEMFCKKTSISWSDTLLDTTLHGRQAFYGDITGFDLKPVYNTYEEYLSELDRFRISVIAAPWQKKFGYPYVSSLSFSRREAEELFFKEFRFEEKLVFHSDEEKREFRRWACRLMRNSLLITRRKEIMEKAVSSRDSVEREKK